MPFYFTPSSLSQLSCGKVKKSLILIFFLCNNVSGRIERKRQQQSLIPEIIKGIHGRKL